jgi:hypothetical protein
MSINIIILTGLFYLVPGMVEFPIMYAERNGNMGLQGLYLDIKNKRNFVYTTASSYIIFSFTKMYIVKHFFCILLLFSNYCYFNTIYTWKNYIL